MSRALRFSKAELANAARVAKESGVAMKLDRDGSILLFPDPKTLSGAVPNDDDDLDAELAAFEVKHGYR